MKYYEKWSTDKESYTHFFNSNSVLLNFLVSKIQLEILLRYCLIHISIIIGKHVLCLVYFWLDPCLFMPYLFDLLLIFIFMYIMIDRIISKWNRINEWKIYILPQWMFYNMFYILYCTNVHLHLPWHWKKNKNCWMFFYS